MKKKKKLVTSQEKKVELQCLDSSPTTEVMSGGCLLLFIIVSSRGRHAERPDDSVDGVHLPQEIIISQQVVDRDEAVPHDLINVQQWHCLLGLGHICLVNVFLFIAY